MFVVLALTGAALGASCTGAVWVWSVRHVSSCSYCRAELKHRLLHEP